jgi:hypothetical protein
MSLFADVRGLRPANVLAAALVAAAILGTTLTTPAAASTSSDKAQAKKYLLTLSDMPKGWKTEKNSSGNGSGTFPGAKQLAGCIGVPSNLINANPPEVDSPYFETKSGSLEVQDTVSIFSSAKVARASLAAMANPKTPSCMAALMNGSFKSSLAASAGKGAEVGTITVGRIDPAEFGRDTTGLVMSLPVTDQGVSITADIQAVFYVKGKFGQQITFNSYGSTFPAATAKSLTATALNRL